MYSLVAIEGAAIFVLGVVSDVITAAVIAGIFSCLNTALNVAILTKQRQLHQDVLAPRRAVYDERGNIIGTIMPLDTARDKRLERAARGEA